MSELIEGAAPAASDPSTSAPTLAPSAPADSPPSRSAPVPVRSPFAWAREQGIDLALVAGAAVLARWPAGNLHDGSLLVSEADFNAAMKAFAGLRIHG